MRKEIKAASKGWSKALETQDGDQAGGLQENRNSLFSGKDENGSGRVKCTLVRVFIDYQQLK